MKEDGACVVVDSNGNAWLQTVRSGVLRLSDLGHVDHGELQKFCYLQDLPLYVDCKGNKQNLCQSHI